MNLYVILDDGPAAGAVFEVLPGEHACTIEHAGQCHRYRLSHFGPGLLAHFRHLPAKAKT